MAIELTDARLRSLELAQDARLRMYAEAAARDDRKLAKAVRTVRAALDLGLISLDELDGSTGRLDGR